MFEPGKLYKRRKDLHGKHGGQWQGGISTPSDEPFIFIFTSEKGEQYGYKDEFKPDGTFWYTGEGQKGDMAMLRGNAAIRHHQKDGKVVHLFEDAKGGSVRYVGEASYLNHHHEDRPDVDGNLRQAIVFELEVEAPTPTGTAVQTTDKPEKSKRLWSRSMKDLKRLAQARPSTNTPPKERKAIAYQRSEAVRVYVLRRADGTCEGCGKNAPFVTKKNRPYLEPHHIRRVADGGPDDPRWVAALCPNCHREVHYGKGGEAINERLTEYLGTVESD